jgi:phosphatidylglycerophosphate synthase
VIPANSYGKWKAWFESIMIIAFLLSVCRPQYLQLVMFVLSAVFGLLSLVTHLVNLFRKTKTLH